MNKILTLDQLGIKHGTDKNSEHHDYCRIYDSYFSGLRGEGINLLELGFGGHEDPEKGGESALMWAEYGSLWNIHSVDISPKVFDHPQVWLHTGSQNDPVFLRNIILSYGHPAIIIDDASHLSSLTIKSFEILFPMLQSGGFYCIEDTHSSIHAFFYGTDEANENPKKNGRKTITTMNYFKNLVDAVNDDLTKPQYRSGHDIEFIHFYKDLIIIKKK